MNGEIWVNAEFLGSEYFVSNLGRIKRVSKIYRRMHLGEMINVPIPEKVYALRKLSKKGYQRVNINGKVRFVHRIICFVFHGPPPSIEKSQVNHIDGNKLNNRPENLEWVTNQENRDHAVKCGLVANRKNGKLGKLTIEDIYKIIELRKNGLLQKEIGKKMNVCQQTISTILKKFNDQ